MGIIQKQYKNDDFDIEITVDSFDEEENREDGYIASIDFNSMDRYSFEELMELSMWIRHTAAQIRKEFDSKGFPKK